MESSSEAKESGRFDVSPLPLQESLQLNKSEQLVYLPSNTMLQNSWGLVLSC